MKKIYLIFDYFKEAFHINKGTRALYRPQIMMLVMNLLLIAAIGVELYFWTGKREFFYLVTGKHELSKIIPGIASVSIGLIVLVLISIALARVVEAGLYNMYKKIVTEGLVSIEDFWEGISKFFFKFLLGDLLIFIVCLMFLPFYFLTGILTLTVGLAVIPMLVGVFLGMWKVSLVMNDSTTFAAIKDSIQFAKRNFIPLSVVSLIHWSFGNGFRGNMGNQVVKFKEHQANDYSNIPVITEQTVGKIIDIGRMVLVVVIPVTVVAVAVANLVKMIFEVFFTLVLFIVYKNGFRTEDEYIDVEVLD